MVCWPRGSVIMCHMLPRCTPLSAFRFRVHCFTTCPVDSSLRVLCTGCLDPVRLYEHVVFRRSRTISSVFSSLRWRSSNFFRNWCLHDHSCRVVLHGPCLRAAAWHNPGSGRFIVLSIFSLGGALCIVFTIPSPAYTDCLLSQADRLYDAWTSIFSTTSSS